MLRVVGWLVGAYLAVTLASAVAQVIGCTLQLKREGRFNHASSS